jgi:membrane protease YdiL (CAAX protease family)
MLNINSAKAPILLRAIAVSLLCLIDRIVFGFPNSSYSVFTGSIALSIGTLYYFIERWRLGIANQGALRITKRWSLTNQGSFLTLGILLWTAIAEEVLFRWYVLRIPLSYGLLPPLACILLSGGAFALSHQNFGTDTMISRGIFGAFLTLPVLFWNNLFVAIVAHVTYNALVHICPVQYIQLKKEV